MKTGKFYGVSYCPRGTVTGAWENEGYYFKRDDAQARADEISEKGWCEPDTKPIVTCGHEHEEAGNDLYTLECRLCNKITVHSGDVHDSSYVLLNSDCSDGICSTCAYASGWNYMECENCDVGFSPREDNTWECPACGHDNDEEKESE